MGSVLRRPELEQRDGRGVPEATGDLGTVPLSQLSCPFPGISRSPVNEKFPRGRYLI